MPFTRLRLFTLYRPASIKTETLISRHQKFASRQHFTLFSRQVK